MAKVSFFDRLGLYPQEQREDFAQQFLPGTKKRQIVDYLLHLLDRKEGYSHRKAVEHIYGLTASDPSYRRCYQSYIHLLKSIEQRFEDWENWGKGNRIANTHDTQLPWEKLLSEEERLFYQARYWYSQGNVEQALQLLEPLLLKAATEKEPVDELLFGAAYELYLMLFDSRQGGMVRERPLFTEKGEFLTRLLLRSLWIFVYENAIRLRFRPTEKHLQAVLTEMEHFARLPRFAKWQPVIRYFQRLLNAIAAFSRMERSKIAENYQTPLPHPEELSAPYPLSFFSTSPNDPATVYQNFLDRAQDALHSDLALEAYELFHQAIAFMPPTVDPGVLLYAYAQLIRTMFSTLRFDDLADSIAQYRRLAHQYHHPFHQALADVYEVRYALFQPDPQLSAAEMLQRLEQMSVVLGKNFQGQLSLLRIQAKVAFRFEDAQLLETIFEQVQDRRFRIIHHKIVKDFIRLLYYAYQQLHYSQQRRSAYVRKLWRSFRTINIGESQFKSFLIEWIERFVPARVLGNNQ